MNPAQMERLALILAHLLILDGAVPAPDAQDLREVSRVVLEEQLRELQADSPEVDALVRRLRSRRSTEPRLD